MDPTQETGKIYGVAPDLHFCTTQIIARVGVCSVSAQAFLHWKARQHSTVRRRPCRRGDTVRADAIPTQALSNHEDAPLQTCAKQVILSSAVFRLFSALLGARRFLLES